MNFRNVLMILASKIIWFLFNKRIYVNVERQEYSDPWNLYFAPLTVSSKKKWS
jgi:hypothetical protein